MSKAKWEPSIGSSCTDCGQVYTRHTENGETFVDCANRCLTRDKTPSKDQNQKVVKRLGITTYFGPGFFKKR